MPKKFVLFHRLSPLVFGHHPLIVFSIAYFWPVVKGF
jgi:hypothetical protein